MCLRTCIVAILAVLHPSLHRQTSVPTTEPRENEVAGFRLTVRGASDQIKMESSPTLHTVLINIADHDVVVRSALVLMNASRSL